MIAEEQEAIKLEELCEIVLYYLIVINKVKIIYQLKSKENDMGN